MDPQAALSSKSTSDHMAKKHEEIFLWYADIVEMTAVKDIPRNK